MFPFEWFFIGRKPAWTIYLFTPDKSITAWWRRYPFRSYKWITALYRAGARRAPRHSRRECPAPDYPGPALRCSQLLRTAPHYSQLHHRATHHRAAVLKHVVYDWDNCLPLQCDTVGRGAVRCGAERLGAAWGGIIRRWAAPGITKRSVRRDRVQRLEGRLLPGAAWGPPPTCPAGW